MLSQPPQEMFLIWIGQEMEENCGFFKGSGQGHGMLVVNSGVRRSMDQQQLSSFKVRGTRGQVSIGVGIQIKSQVTLGEYTIVVDPVADGGHGSTAGITPCLF